MPYRVDPQLVNEFRNFGGDTVTTCFNCGNCSAVCALSEGDIVFPRRFIRLMQLGLTEKMKESPDPWLCYYCGACSDTCPRQAEPGELMMSARRWLTSMYDWTGISRLMYKHDYFEIIMLALVSVVVLLLFTLPKNFGFNLLAEHPEASQSVMLQFFAPKDYVHVGDLILAALLGVLLLSNSLRMITWVMRGANVPLSAYVSEFKELVIHLFTQKRWGKCDNVNKWGWLRHIVLVTGYATIFILVVVFLPAFQVENTAFHWTSLLGYYSTVVLLGVTTWMISDRIRKTEQIHKHSELSDWMFPILLLLTALTGISMHIFRLTNMAMPTYYMYVIHMMIAVPMLVIEVPFGKWAHLAYRPLSAYLQEVRKHAQPSEVKVKSFDLVPGT